MNKYILASLLLLLGFGASAADKAPEKIVKVQVTENGFEPSEIKVKPGTHVILNVTRTTNNTCATEIQVKEKKLKASLKDLNKTIPVDLGIVQKGDIRFACGMDMLSGHIIAE